MINYGISSTARQLSAAFGFSKGRVIYDLTFIFVQGFLSKGDRTVDQMVQAARSGKQNIVEGCAASMTSRETEIKLLNVAKASLQELLVDYEDYIRVRSMELWVTGHPRLASLRATCYHNNDSAYYRNLAPKLNAEEFCNLVITLIHQTDLLLQRLIRTVEKQFLNEGGIREQMSKARIDYRNRQKDGG